MMNNQRKIDEIKKMLDECDFYNRIHTRLEFDAQCICPKNALEQASKDDNRISLLAYKIRHSKKFIRLVNELHDDHKDLNELDTLLVKKLYKDYLFEKNMSVRLMEKLNNAYSLAYINWLKAKEEVNYDLFKPYLKEVINLTKKSFSLLDEQKDTLYDTILDYFEPKWSIKRYDDFFNKLKKAIIPLLKRIQKSKKVIRDDFLSYKVPVYKQEEFSKYLLLKEGHNFDNLVLFTTEHPYTCQVSSLDERITTHYYEDNFLSNLYSIMHEGGHGLFDLNEPSEFFTHHINQNMTMAMHECMSRLFENMIARSEAFVHLIYPKFKELFKEEFFDVSEKELYEASNIVKASLNRCDADELTYCLHIIVRYELEKEFINGKTNVNGLNKRWNKLYKKYLGVNVPNDKEGILQDVHWTSTFGYFPTYALGSCYAAQIYHYMNKDIDIEKEIKNDNIKVIVDWLKTHSFSIASIKDPDEWIKEVTKEEFNPQYYIEYLVNKYTKLYELD
ncbi:MAG: carboxypeptidase M32 [Bacillales bacterium]|nr:carboxypeptidase M32 [Bacillales bacterium]